MNILPFLCALSLLTSGGFSSAQLSHFNHETTIGSGACPQLCHSRRELAVQDCRKLKALCSVSRCAQRNGRPGFSCTDQADQPIKVPIPVGSTSTCSLSTTPTFSGYKPGCECNDGSYTANLIGIIVILFADTRCLTECYLTDSIAMEQCSLKDMSDTTLHNVTRRCCQRCGGYYSGYCRLEAPEATMVPETRDEDGDCQHAIEEYQDGVRLRCECDRGRREESELAIVGGVSRDCVQNCLMRRVDEDDVCAGDIVSNYVTAVQSDLDMCCRSCGGRLGELGIYEACGRNV